MTNLLVDGFEDNTFNAWSFADGTPVIVPFTIV
jgi:hypothetical protein